MEEVFASPAKRQRVMGCDPAIDNIDGIDYSSGMKGSRLKDNSQHSSSSRTPSRKQTQQDPHTPVGAKIKQQLPTSTDDGLLNLSPQMLAPNLMVLNQILGALYVTLPMVRARGKAATYNNLRGPVQNFCGRDFQVSHVQSIKALLPEALGWEHILAFNPETRRQEQQLCLNLPTTPGNPKQLADTTHLQQQLYQRLQQHQAAAGAKVSELELPQADLPPAAAPSARDCTPTRQRTSAPGASSGALLPATPQTAPPAAGSSHASSRPLLSPPPRRLNTALRAEPPAAGLMMSPPPARTRGGVRKLGALAAAAGGDAFTFSPAPGRPGESLLFSPRGGGSTFGTPAKSSNEPAAAAATLDAGSLTPSLRPNRLFDTPVATATPQQPSAARPNTHATPEAGPAGAAAKAATGGVKVRKLTFDAAAPSAAKAAAAAAPPTGPKKQASCTVSAVACSAGAESGGQAPVRTSCTNSSSSRASVTKGGLKFELSATAMALLEQVASAEVKQEEQQLRDVLDQQRALDLLPASFEALRAVFGDRGPCVKAKTEVVQLLRQKSTCKGGMSLSDAAEQLDLMARLVPEFLRQVTAPGTSLASVTHSVRISRQTPWPAARQRLMAAAADARHGGCAVAQAAVQAEQEREQQQDAEDREVQRQQEEAEDAAAGGSDVEWDDDDSSNMGSNCGEDLATERSARQDKQQSLAAVAAADDDGILGQLGGSNGGSSSCKAPASATDIWSAFGAAACGSKGSAARGGAPRRAFLGALAFKAPAVARPVKKA